MPGYEGHYQRLSTYLLDGRDNNERRIKYARWAVRLDADTIGVRHHETVVAEFRVGWARYDAQDWRSSTTKTTINDWLPPYWFLYQDDYVWYLSVPCSSAKLAAEAGWGGLFTGSMGNGMERFTLEWEDGLEAIEIADGEWQVIPAQMVASEQRKINAALKRAVAGGTA